MHPGPMERERLMALYSLLALGVSQILRLLRLDTHKRTHKLTYVM